MTVDSFTGKLAVVSGGGSGMARELMSTWSSATRASAAAKASSPAAGTCGSARSPSTAAVRAKPEAAYDYAELFSALATEPVP
ncbi:MAG TPA: hypothetical protein VHN16_18105 [Streptosporangiaceae bacterium]|nr:hypothetical protein [Streptosporangiaceae bacterium]